MGGKKNQIRAEAVGIYLDTGKGRKQARRLLGGQLARAFDEHGEEVQELIASGGTADELQALQAEAAERATQPSLVEAGASPQKPARLRAIAIWALAAALVAELE